MEAARLVVAYEPVWAIGTGRTATPADIAKVHQEIRRLLLGLVGEGAEKVRILYGGSVKPDNARELLSQANVDSAPVGGARLDPRAFGAIDQRRSDERPVWRACASKCRTRRSPYQ